MVFEHYPQQCCSLLAYLSLYVSLDSTIDISSRADISTKRLELCEQVINTVAQLRMPHCLFLEKKNNTFYGRLWLLEECTVTVWYEQMCRR